MTTMDVEEQLQRMNLTSLDQLGVAMQSQPSQRENLREDQIENSEGGYVWAVNDLNRVRRFLILGTTGGSFYASEKTLTMENAKALIDIIEKGNGALILREIVEISLDGRAPNQNSTLFALALCARYKVKDNTGRDGGTSEQQYYRALQLAAFEAVNCVCRIPTHLFTFVEYCELIAKATGVKENSSGWGRGMRATIGNWYKSKDPSLLAMHITKYPQRGGWSHRDLLRLAHPRVDPERDFDRSELLRYAVKGEISLKRRREGEDSEGMTEEEPPSKALLLVNAVLDVKKLALETDEQKAVELIAKFGLVREHLPPDFLNSVPVWRALLQKMPMTAMIRNLAKMTVIGLLADGAGEVNNVVAKLTDPEQLKAARIHPMSVLMASTTYTAGHGDKGKLQWTPVVAITKALDEAFYLSFKNVEPTNKRYCIAVDVSGSMGCHIRGSSLSCSEAAAAMAMVSLRTEPLVETVAFSNRLTVLPFEKDWSLGQVLDYTREMTFSATDCALPMMWAMEQKKTFDVFIVITDSETYFGDIHPSEALKKYRTMMDVKDARLIVMGMVANEFTIADPTDPGMLDVVGFDAAVPQIIHDFVLGRI